MPNKGAAANRRPARVICQRLLQADRAFPAAVAELGR